MSVIQSLEALPRDSVTAKALHMLDVVVPGEWEDIASFDRMCAQAAGSDKPRVIAAVKNRAQQIDNYKGENYHRALKVFALVDTVDQVAAGAAVASKIGSLFGADNFLARVAPKPSTTQSIDAGAKLVAELVGFGLLNGLPTSDDGLIRYAAALQDYAKYDLMRLAAWVVFDGLLPLGPDFVQKILDSWKTAGDGQLAKNPVFRQLASQLPGKGADEKRHFALNALDTTGTWVTKFVEEKGLTQEKALAGVKQILGKVDGGGDYLAAAIDAGTAYYSHTGTQTVARSLARDAVEQLREEQWQAWIASR